MHLRTLIRFDVLVNGGGAVTLQFQRSPFIPLTRTVFVPWNQIVVLPPVVMTLGKEGELYKSNQPPSPAVGKHRFLFLHYGFLFVLTRRLGTCTTVPRRVTRRTFRTRLRARSTESLACQDRAGNRRDDQARSDFSPKIPLCGLYVIYRPYYITRSHTIGVALPHRVFVKCYFSRSCSTCVPSLFRP